MTGPENPPSDASMPPPATTRRHVDTVDDLRWEAAYWQLAAIERARIWFNQPRRFDTWWPYFSSDEYSRVTLVLGTPVTGHVVVALWRERTPDLKADLAALHQIVDNN